MATVGTGCLNKGEKRREAVAIPRLWRILSGLKLCDTVLFKRFTRTSLRYWYQKEHG